MNPGCSSFAGLLFFSINFTFYKSLSSLITSQGGKSKTTERRMIEQVFSYISDFLFTNLFGNGSEKPKSSSLQQSSQSHQIQGLQSRFTPRLYPVNPSRGLWFWSPFTMTCTHATALLYHHTNGARSLRIFTPFCCHSFGRIHNSWAVSRLARMAAPFQLVILGSMSCQIIHNDTVNRCSWMSISIHMERLICQIFKNSPFFH